MIKKELRTRPDYIDEYVWEQYQIHRKNIKKQLETLALQAKPNLR